MSFRAIPTEYRGTLFRSKTEARWAVFFDSLGVKWKYEHEGYDLPSGKYLPDFWLPNARTFLEVKGKAPTDREIRLCHELIGTPAEYEVFIATGDPSDNNILRVLYEWEGVIWTEPSHGEMCIRCQRPDSFHFGTCFDCLLRDRNGLGRKCPRDGWGGCDDCWRVTKDQDLVGFVHGGAAARLIRAAHDTIDRAIEVSRTHRFWNPPRARP